MEVTHSILTRGGNKFRARLMRQETVSMDEMTYLLGEYDIQDYGETVFSKEPVSENGKFRSARSMIPFEQLDKRAKDFDWTLYGDDNPDAEKGRRMANAFVLNFQKFRQAGKGLYLHSATKGTGKTYLSYCLANEIMARYDVNVKFTSVLEYLDLTKKGYSSAADKEEKDSILKASVLILDDIGVEVSKEWVNTTLYQLINYRYSNKLITVFTSNYQLEQLRIDDRIKDRINFMCLPLHLPEVPIRSMETDKANSEFINEILRT